MVTTDENVLVNFYKTIQPAGLWGPVKRQAKKIFPEFKKESFRISLLNVVVGIPWLFSLWVFPMYLVARAYGRAAVFAGITVILSAVLYFTWYRREIKPT